MGHELQEMQQQRRTCRTEVRQVGGASHTGDRGLELSEENREVRKWLERNFGEKWSLGGYG